MMLGMVLLAGVIAVAVVLLFGLLHVASS
jgi:hypothetical protein